MSTLVDADGHGLVMLMGKGGVGKTTLAAAVTVVHSPLLRQRAANELKEIEAVANVHTQHYPVVPILKEESIGVERLLDLSQANY
jgi:replication-associated recombination protein RarA